MPTTERAAKGWYEAVTGSDLAHGDLLQQVLLPFISSSDPNRPEVVLERTSAVVLTQTCDLENQKVTQVLLGAVVEYDSYAEVERSRGNQFVASRRFRKAVLEEHCRRSPSYVPVMLPVCPSNGHSSTFAGSTPCR